MSSSAHLDRPVHQPVRGVIFDLHSTLLDQGRAADWLAAALEREPRALSHEQRMSLLAFLDRIWEGARIRDPQSSRDLSIEDHRRIFHELVDAGPGLDRSFAHALYETLFDSWHVYQDTIPTLRTLREMDIPVCLLSNMGVPIHHVLEREGMTPWFDEMVLSYEVGVVKPDIRIFEIALERLGMSPAEVLMVGDNANDDGGGTRLGLRTLILPRTQGDVHGLAAVPAMIKGINQAFA